MQNWAAAELETVKLGDGRLKQRLIRIVERLAERPAVSIPAACKNWAETKATYRFLSSEKVETEAIRAAHRVKTIERLRGKSCVLVAQDTTELNYSGHQQTQGLGPLRHSAGQGLHLHSGMAIRLDGVPLGLLYQEIWSRSPRPRPACTVPVVRPPLEIRKVSVGSIPWLPAALMFLKISR